LGLSNTKNSGFHQNHFHIILRPPAIQNIEPAAPARLEADASAIKENLSTPAEETDMNSLTRAVVAGLWLGASAIVDAKTEKPNLAELIKKERAVKAFKGCGIA
jgi:hypothetical protein